MLCVNDSSSVKDVVAKISGYVNYINEHVEDLESRGPVSKYTLPDEGLRGKWVFLCLCFGLKVFFFLIKWIQFSS